METALIFAAHPDDEVLICGGTAKKLVDSGWDVHVMYLTNSDAAAYGEEDRMERIERAQKEAELARDILGLKMVELPRFHDMFVGDRRGDLIQTMICAIRLVKPTIVFGHSKTDFHIDHRTVGELLPEAVYQAARDVCGEFGEKVDEPLLLVGDVDLEIRNFSDPDIVIDITDYIEDKVNALKCYDSLIEEHALFSQSQLEDWCRITCRARGIYSTEFKHAEGFKKANIVPFLVSEVEQLEVMKTWLPK